MIRGKRIDRLDRAAETRRAQQLDQYLVTIGTMFSLDRCGRCAVEQDILCALTAQSLIERELELLRVGGNARVKRALVVRGKQYADKQRKRRKDGFLSLFQFIKIEALVVMLPCVADGGMRRRIGLDDHFARVFVPSGTPCNLG